MLIQNISQHVRTSITPPYTHRDIPVIAGTVTLFLGLLLAVVSFTPAKQFLFSPESISAAENDGIVEPETGTMSGDITTGIDPGVNGGGYVQFGQAPPPAFQPTAPYHASFFYLWYKNVNTDGAWSYWTDHANTPPNSWFSHYLPDSNPAVFDPAEELYSSHSYETFKWQAAKLAEAKQEVAIASWWGQNRKEDTAFNTIITDFMGRADNPYPNLRWSMYYENEGFGDPSVATLVDDLTFIKNTYTNSPYYLNIDGKPVIFVYGDAADMPGTLLARWNDANTQVGNHFHYVLKVFSGYSTATPQPSSWHQYAPANRGGQHGADSYYVSPGFWLDDNVSTERLVRDAAAFESTVQDMVMANTRWKLVQTWNEWGEGTSVEPGEQTTKNGSGQEILHPSGYPFKNLYIDILNRNLPALEQGTGR